MIKKTLYFIILINGLKLIMSLGYTLNGTCSADPRNCLLQFPILNIVLISLSFVALFIKDRQIPKLVMILFSILLLVFSFPFISYLLLSFVVNLI